MVISTQLPLGLLPDRLLVRQVGAVSAEVFGWEFIRRLHLLSQSR